MVQKHQGDAFMAQAKVKPEILDLVKQYGAYIKQRLPIQQVILFGSQAKGNTHEWSDIDVCIVSPSFGKDFFEEKLELDRYTDNFSTKIEPTPMNPITLQSKYNTLAHEIREHGIEIKI